ncbi:uncharacterized protein BP01DRAFT_88123 [Aspergillus saccharolyticus JOP 1030-1]|uniref:67 kDa myosin-cross-reactive antigen family protein n=1 Tax=Aspergillus saccharolyticus JOP 1030-1 TaxID=1450539 RepID=A0A318Z9H0_9EURO|nr:hypothetical protein BP01DRAFT_88123 [Aspergillus saccharolyticus JOP 1030-1]PYH44051.1 hypothetical protein BP01DRAFT_88123 [Aspergillus saccharolyticus JOP 1030-1]
MSRPTMTTTHNHPPPTVWLIGGGVESLVAASCLINEARVPGNHIRILDSRRQPQSTTKHHKKKTSHKDTVTLQTQCQDLPCASTHQSYQPPALNAPLSFPKEACSLPCSRHRTEVFMSEPINFLSHLGCKQVWRKNRKDVLHFLLQDEAEYEGMSIQRVFDESFFDSYFWRLFSSSFGLRPLHSAVEFHRYISKYLDEVIGNTIHVADPLPFSLRRTVLRPLRAYLRNQGVQFRHLLVTDIHFTPEREPKTACGIQAVGKRGAVLLPVQAEDRVIVTIGSAASGISTGSPAAAPPASSTRAELLLDPSWSLWFALARKSSQCGNPSSFCTHLPDSRLGMFVIHLPRADFDAIHRRMLPTNSSSAAAGGRTDASITHSPWTFKLIFSADEPSPASTSRNPPTPYPCILGYGFTPDTTGHHIQKPMHACSGDEILAELLGCLDLPADPIIRTARVIPYTLPLGLSPLLQRGPGDRPAITPSDLANVALVGQYVEVPEETALMTAYSVRSAQLAVQRLVGAPTETVSEVHKSFLAARYGRKGGVSAR